MSSDTSSPYTIYAFTSASESEAIIDGHDHDVAAVGACIYSSFEVTENPELNAELEAASDSAIAQLRSTLEALTRDSVVQKRLGESARRHVTSEEWNLIARKAIKQVGLCGPDGQPIQVKVLDLHEAQRSLDSEIREAASAFDLSSTDSQAANEDTPAADETGSVDSCLVQ